MAKGKIYGFGEMAGLDLLMLNLASGTEDVSRANWIAMLVTEISIGIITFIETIVDGHILVNGLIVVQAGMSFACVQTAGQWAA
jgi:hypothetical protein